MNGNSSVGRTAGRKPLVYGEVHPNSIASLLGHRGAKPGHAFYDLGGGDGRGVAVAWLLGLRATGFGLVASRHNASCRAVARLRALPPSPHPQREACVADACQASVLRFVHGSFFDEYGLFDAAYVFIHAVLWSPPMMKRLVGHTLSCLRKGAQAIIVGLGAAHTFAKLAGTRWRCAHGCAAGFNACVSWRKTCTGGSVRVFRKAVHPAPQRPPGTAFADAVRDSACELENGVFSVKL